MQFEGNKGLAPHGQTDQRNGMQRWAALDSKKSQYDPSESGNPEGEEEHVSELRRQGDAPRKRPDTYLSACCPRRNILSRYLCAKCKRNGA